MSVGVEQKAFQPKQWHDFEIPVLFTPINSIEILRQKRLTIVVQLYERNKPKPENFAYINVLMKDLAPVEKVNRHTGEKSWDCELLVHNLPVIGFNRVLGRFQAVIHFKVVNCQ